MAGHAQLKFVMTECSKTPIRLTGLNSIEWRFDVHQLVQLKLNKLMPTNLVSPGNHEHNRIPCVASLYTIFEPENNKTYKMICWPSEDSGHPVHLRGSLRIP